MERHIEYMPVDGIVPNERNPKDHTLHEIEMSMDRFGYTEPILLDERTGKLIAGHGRVEVLQAIKAAGMAAPDGVSIGDDGTWSIPVVRGWQSKDDIEASAYLIASNRLTEKGGWHADPLADLLAEIRDSGHGLDGIGYDETEVQDLVDQIAGPPDLDALARELGDPHESDFWPVLRFKVPPSLRGRYLALTAEVPGGDAEQFEWLVTRAEEAERGVRRN